MARAYYLVVVYYAVAFYIGAIAEKFVLAH